MCSRLSVSVNEFFCLRSRVPRSVSSPYPLPLRIESFLIICCQLALYREWMSDCSCHDGHKQHDESKHARPKRTQAWQSARIFQIFLSPMVQFSKKYTQPMCENRKKFSVSPMLVYYQASASLYLVFIACLEHVERLRTLVTSSISVENLVAFHPFFHSFEYKFFINCQKLNLSFCEKFLLPTTDSLFVSSHAWPIENEKTKTTQLVCIRAQNSRFSIENWQMSLFFGNPLLK